VRELEEDMVEEWGGCVVVLVVGCVGCDEV
jgi:hypothetical protein